VDQLAEANAIFRNAHALRNMAAQMRNFPDQTGGLWMKGALIGKVCSVFASTGTSTEAKKHDTTFHPRCCTTAGHRRCAYSESGLTTWATLRAHAICATTLAGQTARANQPKRTEIARYQGKHVTEIAGKTLFRKEVSCALNPIR